MDLEDRYREFESAAVGFSEELERKHPGEPNPFEGLRRSLTRLYLAAVNLPAVDGGAVDVPVPITVDEVKLMRSCLRRYLRGFHQYWVIHEPVTPKPEQPVLVSLVDDFMIIWFDLELGLRLLEVDRESYEGIVRWDWRHNFETRWGIHAVAALYAMHGRPNVRA